MVVPFMTLYLTEKEYTIGEAGIVFGLFGFGAFSGAWLGGRLTDKIGFYPVQIITLFGGGILFQSNNVNTTEREALVLPRLNTVLNIVYPRRIAYSATEPLPLDISVSCNLPCDQTPINITIRSRPSLLLAQPPIA